MDWIDRIPKNVQTQKQLLKSRLERENTEIHVHVSVGKSVFSGPFCRPNLSKTKSRLSI